MHEVIELAQELDGFEVFPAAVLVRDPLAFLAGIIEVQHRGDGVHAEAVDVIAFAPEEGVGDQEIAHLMPSEIENERAPVLVRAPARILVLVEGGAVEPGEGPSVAREMRRHPVHDHPDARLVQFVHQVLKIFRCPKPAGGGVKAGDLVTPRGIKSMLRHRKELHMREAHVGHVFHQRRGQFPVAERFRRGFFLPRAEMHFIDADG